MIRIGNIPLSLSDSEDALSKKICRILSIPHSSLVRYDIVKKSVDARDRTNVRFIYSVDVALNVDEETVCRRASRGDVTIRKKSPASAPIAVSRPSKRPVVIGAGPAGLFAALTLAKAGANPILVERGSDIDARAAAVQSFWNGGKLDTSTNVQFGEGGAGAFSDGKLNSGTHDARRSKVLTTFAEHGAPREILYLRNPHIGSDNLPKVVKSIRAQIELLGGTVLFNHTLCDIRIKDGAVSAAVCRMEDGCECAFETNNIVLAVGHSARDVFSLLLSLGVSLEQKPFSVGVRIEHLQRDIDKNQYGAFAGNPALPAADYKLSARLIGGRSVYTFCMCPGGSVISAASEDGGVVTNGMSLFARNEKNANSAMLVNIEPADFGGTSPLAGVEFQRRIEQAAFSLAGGGFKAPAQTVEGFLTHKKTGFGHIRPSYLPAVSECEIGELFPEFVTLSLRAGLSAFSRQLTAFSDRAAVLTAPETRSSSPVRILRGDGLEASLHGLFPCGEGAGYAGGILSSAVDGIRVAEAILKI